MVGDHWSSRAIRRWQAGIGYPPLTCDATHVALYAGNGEVIHAIMSRVVRQPVHDYFTGRDMAVATWQAPVALGQTRPVLDARLVSAAERWIGQPYEWLRALDQILGGQDDAGAPMVCSTFIDIVFDTVFGAHSPLFAPGANLPVPFPPPAHVFGQPSLIEPA